MSYTSFKTELREADLLQHVDPSKTALWQSLDALAPSEARVLCMGASCFRTSRHATLDAPLHPVFQENVQFIGISHGIVGNLVHLVHLRDCQRRTFLREVQSNFQLRDGCCWDLGVLSCDDIAYTVIKTQQPVPQGIRLLLMTEHCSEEDYFSSTLPLAGGTSEKMVSFEVETQHRRE